jgi:signal transduction histidine kinase
MEAHFKEAKLISRELALKWRVPIVVSLAAVIVILQIFEYYFHHTEFDLIFLLELFVFIVLLLLIFLLFNLFWRAMMIKDRAVHILELKNRVGLELSAAQDWEELVDRILKFFSDTIQITQISIELFDRSIDRFETIVERSYSEERVKIGFLPSLGACEQYNQAAAGSLHSLQTCTRLDREKIQCPINGFCYPLFLNNVPVAIVHFLLPIDTSLTAEQTDILHYVNKDIASALVRARQRRLILDMQANKVAMEERLSIFRDLHDNLGQTLACICLKLSQLTKDECQPQEIRENIELSKLSTIAQEAYCNLRDTLDILRMENQGQLGNLITEHSKMVMQRSNINVQVSTTGLSRRVPPFVIRQIVYIFREALANVERHAQAKNVDVQLNWSENEIILRVVDDGHGFDPGNVRKEGHYGLDIMRERAMQIKGQMILNSNPKGGTEILLCVPIDSV